MKISIIMPSYNEAENLKEAIPNAVETLRSVNLTFEVIIINDGSTDDTKEVINGFIRKYPEVKLVNHEKNKGKSTAMYTGFLNSSGDYVVLFEPDLQYDIRDLFRFIPSMRLGYDIINGYRINRSDPFHRKKFSLFYNRIIRFLFGIRVADHNSGFKAFRRDVALKLFNPNLIKKIGLTSRVFHRVALVIANKFRYTIDEIPVRHYNRKYGKSYIHPIKTPFETFGAIIKAFLINNGLK